ncbi:MAG: ABC transporter substrate-binding protein [Planctomycetaceae bacterium]
MRTRLLKVAVAGFSLALIGVVLPQAAANAATGTNCSIKNQLANSNCQAVVMATVSKVNNLDPMKARAVTDYQVAYPIQGLLWRFDENLIPRMDLVAKQDVAKDGLSVFQVLKPGLVYSDGTPLVAQDVVTAVNNQLVARQAAAFFAKIESVTATSPTTLTWKLKTPYPDFNWLMANQAMFINPTEKLKDPNYWKAPVSAGPMKIQSWTPGADQMVQVANPNYWAKPKVQQITFVAIPDAATRKLALQSGQVDYVFDLAYQGVQDLDKNIIRWWAHALPGTYQITTNTAKAGSPMLNAKNRQAISAAIDRQAIAKVAFFGTVLPSCAQTFIKGNPYHQCVLPNEGKRDVALAKKLLAEAGNPNGFSIDMTVWARPAWPEAAQLIKQQLAEVGITVNITVKQDTVAIADLNSGNYETQFGGNNAPTPYLQLANWFGIGGAWQNWSKENNPPLIAAIDRLGSAMSPAAAKTALQAANVEAYNSSVHIPVADRAVISGSRLPQGLLSATVPGEWLYVATTPLLSTQRGPAGFNTGAKS